MQAPSPSGRRRTRSRVNAGHTQLLDSRYPRATRVRPESQETEEEGSGLLGKFFSVLKPWVGSQEDESQGSIPPMPQEDDESSIPSDRLIDAGSLFPAQRASITSKESGTIEGNGKGQDNATPQLSDTSLQDNDVIWPDWEESERKKLGRLTVKDLREELEAYHLEPINKPDNQKYVRKSILIDTIVQHRRKLLEEQLAKAQTTKANPDKSLTSSEMVKGHSTPPEMQPEAEVLAYAVRTTTRRNSRKSGDQASNVIPDDHSLSSQTQEEEESKEDGESRRQIEEVQQIQIAAIIADSQDSTSLEAIASDASTLARTVSEVSASAASTSSPSVAATKTETSIEKEEVRGTRRKRERASLSPEPSTPGTLQERLLTKKLGSGETLSIEDFRAAVKLLTECAPPNANLRVILRGEGTPSPRQPAKKARLVEKATSPPPERLVTRSPEPLAERPESNPPKQASQPKERDDKAKAQEAKEKRRKGGSEQDGHKSRVSERSPPSGRKGTEPPPIQTSASQSQVPFDQSQGEPSDTPKRQRVPDSLGSSPAFVNSPYGQAPWPPAISGYEYGAVPPPPYGYMYPPPPYMPFHRPPAPMILTPNPYAYRPQSSLSRTFSDHSLRSMGSLEHSQPLKRARVLDNRELEIAESDRREAVESSREAVSADLRRSVTQEPLRRTAALATETSRLRSGLQSATVSRYGGLRSRPRPSRLLATRQRSSASTKGSSSGTVAQKILETLSEMSSPLDEERIKPSATPSLAATKQAAETPAVSLPTPPRGTLGGATSAQPSLAFPPQAVQLDATKKHEKKSPGFEFSAPITPQNIQKSKHVQVAESSAYMFTPPPEKAKAIRLEGNESERFSFAAPLRVVGAADVDGDVSDAVFVFTPPRYEGSEGAKSDGLFSFMPKAPSPSTVVKRVAAPKPPANSSIKNTADKQAAQSASKAPDVTNDLATLFKRDPTEWQCTACLCWNKAHMDKCPACETSKPKDKSAAASTSFQPPAGSSATTSVQVPQPPAVTNDLSFLCKTEPGSWKCEVCLITNKKDAVKCAACETTKPGAPSTGSSGSSIFGSLGDSGAGPKFTFGIPPPNANSQATVTFGLTPGKDESKASGKENSSSLAATPSVGTATGFTFGLPSGTEAFGSTTKDSELPALQPQFTFGGGGPAVATNGPGTKPFSVSATSETNVSAEKRKSEESQSEAEQKGQGGSFSVPSAFSASGGKLPSSLSFGVQSTVEGKEGKKDAPTFTFGAPPKAPSSTISTATPATGFGVSSSSGVEAKPTFSFGSTLSGGAPSTGDPAEASQKKRGRVEDEGGAPEKKMSTGFAPIASSSGGTSFGSSATSAGGFTFGTSGSGSKDGPSKSDVGGNNAEISKVDNSAPGSGSGLFNFGKPSSPAPSGSAFSFGGSQPSNDAGAKGFTFGSATADDGKGASAPPVSAGGVTSPFTFGSKSGEGPVTFGAGVPSAFGASDKHSSISSSSQESSVTSSFVVGSGGEKADGKNPSLGFSSSSVSAGPSFTFGTPAKEESKTTVPFGAASPSPFSFGGKSATSETSDKASSTLTPSSTSGPSFGFGTSGSSSTTLFGATSSSSAPAFGTPSSTQGFGAASSATFGAPSSSNTSSFGGFGSAAPSLQTPASKTGADASMDTGSPVGGKPSSSSLSTPAFGSGSTVSPFGGSSSGAFGASSGFGSSGPASTAPFSGSSTSGFGLSSSGFGGAPPGSSSFGGNFGAPSAQPSPTNFGSSQPAFGTPASTFGAPSTPAFGAPSTPAPTFGGAPSSTFGGGGAGGTPAFTFGAPSSQSTFGAPAGPPAGGFSLGSAPKTTATGRRVVKAKRPGRR